MTIPFQTVDKAPVGAPESGRAWTCSNCASAAPKTVLIRSGRENGQGAMVSLPSTVGTALDQCTGERLLCPDCGVIEAVIEPAAGLRKHLAELAQAGGGAKNEPVVIEGKAHGLRSLVEPRLLDHVRGLGKDKGAFLDIACGEGHMTRRIAHTFQDWQSIGIDTSKSLTEDWPPIGGRPGFLRAAFDPTLFAGRSFDVIAAHGVFTRSAPLLELQRIRSICADGALLSVELPFLDGDIAAPYIWDHIYLLARARFLAFLRQAGFQVLESHDNVVGWHIIARAVEPGAHQGPSAEDLAEARAVFEAHVAWWKDVASRAEEAKTKAQAEGKAIAVHGTGPMSAILCERVAGLKPAFFIDDGAQGTQWRGRPVLTVAEAKDRPATVLLAARPADTDYYRTKLTAAGLTVATLNTGG
ncbi:MAG: class I SAM-dependent methyltransferase [Alphaproteobacteria bacterium]